MISHILGSKDSYYEIEHPRPGFTLPDGAKEGHAHRWYAVLWPRLPCFHAREQCMLPGCAVVKVHDCQHVDSRGW